MRKRPLLHIASVFLAGLAYQRYSLKVLVIGIIVLILWELWLGRQTKNIIKSAGRSILLLSAFLLGVFHMQEEVDLKNAYMSKIEDGSFVTVWGEFIKTESTEYGYRGILSDCYIDFGEGVMPCNDIMVYTSKDQLKAGQIHKISGKVNMFKKARNEGNFDAFCYYQSLKIDFSIEEEEDELLQEQKKNWKIFLLSLKEQISEVYRACFTKKSQGFFQAMVLGDKTELDHTLKELFLLGGISHILAISGLHVSILGRGMYRFLRRFGVSFKVAGLIGGLLLFAYSYMVGNSISTVRAVGMLLFFFFAQHLGRSYDMLNALGAMVLFLLWENPFLIENSGLWFSISALIGVGFVGKEFVLLFEKKEVKTKGEHKRFKRIDLSGLWMSFGITLSTLPITAFVYYEVPVYSPLVNFFVLPILPPMFCLALLGGLIGRYLPMQGISFCLLKICEWMFCLMEWFCKQVAMLPNTSIICGKPQLWQVMLYYLLLFCSIYLLKYLKLSLVKQRGIFFMIIMLGCSFIFWPKPNHFEITFLDVGQGDGIYINAGDKMKCFIDGGSSNVNEVGTNRILPFLKAKGVKSIDYWFVSHTDTDHISGLLEVLNSGYQVDYVIISQQVVEDDVYKSLYTLAKNNKTEMIYMKTGEQVVSKNMRITCLAPLQEGKNSQNKNTDKNEASLVLQVDWYRNGKQPFTALFAGDISVGMEEELCKREVLKDVDLLKANHHGSNYSNGTLLLETILPEYIVVSCSERNHYGHPGREAVKRMEASKAKIFYTMENGQITFPLIQ